MEPSELKQIIHEAMDERKKIGDDLHMEHHQFLSKWMGEIERRRERWDRIRGTVIGGSILMVLTGITTFLGWIAKVTLEATGHK